LPPSKIAEAAPESCCTFKPTALFAVVLLFIISTILLALVEDESESILRAPPVVRPSALMSITVPVVDGSLLIDTQFVVVFSESISSEGRPAARLESINIPLTASDYILRAVVPVAAVLLLMIVAKLLVPVLDESEST